MVVFFSLRQPLDAGLRLLGLPVLQALPMMQSGSGKTSNLGYPSGRGSPVTVVSLAGVRAKQKSNW